MKVALYCARGLITNFYREVVRLCGNILVENEDSEDRIDAAIVDGDNLVDLGANAIRHSIERGAKRIAYVAVDPPPVWIKEGIEDRVQIVYIRKPHMYEPLREFLEPPGNNVENFKERNLSLGAKK